MPGVRTTSLTLINEEQKPVRVQVRVMRWTQENEADVLTPTQDVVASPPQTTLAPGQHYLIRLVRTARAAPVGEEAYRVIVDEISDPANAVPGAVNLVLRQEIPAFFSDEPRKLSIVDWKLEEKDRRFWLTAQNRGNRRLRLSDVVLQLAKRAVAAAVPDATSITYGEIHATQVGEGTAVCGHVDVIEPVDDF